ncbi:MAG TPA: GNAT family N-acetyltransferase [Thermoanaerobaculia bacterium]|nr:GNAT family N-acetyltransferase [Thermoanaerobaculia bacterium]HQR67381.1 GNAT family N-acetyltransferase [Thermoanaerobaculia bacterium]
MPTIRPAAAADAETIASFNEAMAVETEGKALDPATIRAGVGTLLSRPDLGLYLVAEEDGRVVGQLMITFEWSDWRNGVVWWIQSVYVRPECRGRGAYRALHAHVRSRALSDGGVRGLRLYVERENAAAQATYRRLGMRETSYRLFEEIWGGSG